MIMANGFGDNPNLGPHTVQVTENDIWYSIACRSCKGLGSFNQLLVSRNDNARSRWPGGCGGATSISRLNAVTVAYCHTALVGVTV